MTIVKLHWEINIDEIFKLNMPSEHRVKKIHLFISSIINVHQRKNSLKSLNRPGVGNAASAGASAPAYLHVKL